MSEYQIKCPLCLISQIAPPLFAAFVYLFTYWFSSAAVASFPKWSRWWVDGQLGALDCWCWTVPPVNWHRKTSGAMFPSISGKQDKCSRLLAPIDVKVLPQSSLLTYRTIHIEVRLDSHRSFWLAPSILLDSVEILFTFQSCKLATCRATHKSELGALISSTTIWPKLTIDKTAISISEFPGIGSSVYPVGGRPRIP